MTTRVLPVRAWWRYAVTAACWLTSLAVTLLWVRGQGPQGLLTSPSSALISLGRATGLVASDLLLIQVFLMARVPAVERTYGQDELARRQRLVGFWSFNLMVGHILLITFGYAIGGSTDVVHQTWDLLTKYGGILLAAVGTAVLTLVAVTSIRLSRKALRYESWHLLHVYAYLGVALALPHQIWTGNDFVTSGAARAYWWSLYAVAAGSVIVYRVALPLSRTLRHGITVTSVVRESSDVVTVRMGGRGLSRLPVRSGQFFILRLLDGPGWSRGNPYSLSAATRQDRMQITAKDLGDGSGRLAQLRPGTRVLLEGPYGRLTGEQRVGTKGGNAGLRHWHHPDALPARRSALCARRRCPGLPRPQRTGPDLPRRPGIASQDTRDHHPLPDRAANPRRDSWLPSAAAQWSDVEALRRLVPGLKSYDVFVCGPDAWMDAASEAALAAGVPPEQLHQERLTW